MCFQTSFCRHLSADLADWRDWLALRLTSPGNITQNSIQQFAQGQLEPTLGFGLSLMILPILPEHAVTIT